MRKLLVLAFLLLLIVTVKAALAQAPTSTPEPTSFELFWPVSAGKTMGESLYNLKIFKENIRGYLIFGKPQKAEYAIFLATKRLVESEKLLSEGKTKLARKTLDKMSNQLKAASSNLDAAGGKGFNVHEMNNKLNNLETFLPVLASKYSEVKSELDSLLDQVRKINGKV